ncbi:MAG: coenzyme F420-0:L-glutamate ligase [Holosporales bacterium]|jgi:putative folate metabolism gamma-glutamate ligase|nr:coenzyme F420-0:L-glutamate ligase [Holosporales bacterium]
MHVISYKTHKIGVKEDLLALLDRYVPPLAERNVVAITSKVVALCQGRVVEKNLKIRKEDLIKREADWFIEQELSRPNAISITIKEGIFIASAGIDESNAQEYYILWPYHPQQAAAAIWAHLRRRDHLKDLGVILTDSQTRPLRWGVTGVGIAWCGFHPLWDCRGAPDIWGYALRVTTVNVLDGLAAAAVLMMGESAEQTPITVIRDAPYMRFLNTPPTEEETQTLRITLQEDLYAPLLEHASWQQGGGGIIFE